MRLLKTEYNDISFKMDTHAKKTIVSKVLNRFH